MTESDANGRAPVAPLNQSPRRRNLLVGAGCAVVVLLVLYVIAGPFLTLYQVSGALAVNDSEALEDNIDFQRVREGMSASLNFSLQEKLKETGDQNNPFSQLGAMLGGVMVSKVLDTYCTPAGITALFKNQTAQSGAPANADHIVWKGRASYKFESPSRFKLRLVMPDPNDGNIDVILRRSGLSWRIVSIELPFEQMMQGAQNKNSSIGGQESKQNQDADESKVTVQFASGSPTESPRPLTAEEAGKVMQIICDGPVTVLGPKMQHSFHCPGIDSLSQDEPDLIGKDGADITLKSIVYGPITRAQGDQAYVSYEASFEGHADNFGGGILLEHASNGWGLSNWYHGGQLSDCLAVQLPGKRTFLCLQSWMGQGEEDSSISAIQISEKSDQDSMNKLNLELVSSSDTRGTFGDDQKQSDTPPYQCTLARSAAESVAFSLVDLHSVSNGEYFAEASVEYAEPSEMARACQERNLVDIKLTSGKLHFALRNGKVAVDSPVAFAKSR